jgi:hypothetical protein
MVLVKEFRADIPACPTADAGHAIDGNIHLVNPFPVKYRL